jgi:hypothetical protein
MKNKLNPKVEVSKRIQFKIIKKRKAKRKIIT